MNLKQLSSIAALLLLAACAQPNLPQQNSWQAAEQVQDFSADGRLAVKVEGKGSYANFDWTYQNTVQTIDVNTPLGNTVGQLCQDRRSTTTGYGYLQRPSIHYGRHDKRTQIRRIYRIA